MNLRYRRHFKGLRGGRLLFIFALLMGLGIFIFVIIDKNTAPIIINMAEARVRALAVKAMNDAVRVIMTDPVKYTDLIKVVQDKDGRVMMIQADTLKMNEISASAALITQDNLSKIGDQGIGIPLGSVLGGQLLSGRGPNVYARIIPVGSVTTDFESEFQNQGINQTRHKIFLNVHTTVRIVIPTQSKEVNVDCKVLVTECIIVGQVPDYYVNVTDPNQLDLLPRVTIAPK